MVKASVLTHYDPTKKLKLATDTSAYGIGTVLSHTYNDGTERPIGYASRTLSNIEKRYALIDKETLRFFLESKRFMSSFMVEDLCL